MPTRPGPSPAPGSRMEVTSIDSLIVRGPPSTPARNLDAEHSPSSLPPSCAVGEGVPACASATARSTHSCGPTQSTPAKPVLRSAARQVAAAGPRQGALGDQLVHAPPDQPGVGDVNLHRLGGPLGRQPPGCTPTGRRDATPSTASPVTYSGAGHSRLLRRRTWELGCSMTVGWARPTGVQMPDVDASGNTMCNRGKTPFGRSPRRRDG
jgi:hypothetical protein